MSERRLRPNDREGPVHPRLTRKFLSWPFLWGSPTDRQQPTVNEARISGLDHDEDFPHRLPAG